MTIEQAFDAILNGKAIIIAGSGINYGTNNIEEEQIPLGTTLSKELYALAGVDDPDNENDLQDASENYIEKHSKAELIAFLQKKLSISSPSDAAKTIYSLPWLREYTTNYDQLPILADGNSVIPISIDTKPAQYLGKNKKLCVYINGYLGNLSEEKLGSSFKLTTSSYLTTDGMLLSEWGEILREDLARAAAVIVVGLSLDYDLDLKRVIYESQKEKVAIIDAPNIKANKKSKLGQFGTVFDIGINDFASKIVEYRNNCFIAENKDGRLVNFQRNTFHYSDKRIDSMMIRDLLMWGKYENALLSKKRDGSDYIIYRSAITRVIDCINDMNKKVVFIHSNLGNGKTIFIEELKQKLFDLSITCFEYQYRASEAIIDDIEKIVSMEGKKVIIIENYFNHLLMLKKFSSFLSDNITFILTARTMIYDTKLFDVISLLSLSEGQSEILDINKLDYRELQECYRLFEDNGFWGDYTGPNKTVLKRNILKNKRKGNSELRSILLQVMHSHDIQSRLISITDTIRQESGVYYKCIIMMLISTVMSLELSVEDIQKILGISCITDPLFISNPAVKELVEINLSGESRYKIRSAIVANEILKIIDSNEDIISALKEIARYADRYCSVSEKYESILKNTVSFSHVKSFLCNKRDNLDFIIDYYDELKNINYHKENSFFWLQYSIACMQYLDFELAQRYVEVAYSLFRNVGDNVPFQCDNQQARIKLLMIKEGVSSNVKKDFIEAHRLAMLPCKNEKDREESVIRLFQIYVKREFIDTIMRSGVDEEYKKACGEAYNRVQSFLRTLRNERDRDMFTELGRLLMRHSVDSKI